MATILTTTGISLYLNAKREYKTDSPTDDQMRDFLRSKPEAASAEINSLLQMAHTDDSIVLLHTDTTLAEKCAGLLRNFLIAERNFKPFQIRVEKLQFRDDEEYIETQGLRNLVNALAHEIELAQQAGQEVVINATPGFKLEIVYSTMIGMLYGIPIQYMHEKFRRVVTLNPIALDWDTSLFLTNKVFFEWLNQKKSQEEVEDRLKGRPDRERIESFLTPPDNDGNIFLSPLGEVLLLQFMYESEAAEKAEWPPEVQVKNAKDKIARSIVKHGHSYPKWTEDACIKLARIPYVRTIIADHFSSVTQPKIAHIRDNGSIEIYWTEDGKAAKLIVITTAQGYIQTLKVANHIREKLRIN